MDREVWELEGHRVTVTHLDKLFWPEEGITKGDLLHYYQKMGPVMLPYLRDRPVTLHVFPDGIKGGAYYRRERPAHAPRWIRSVAYRPVSLQEVIHVPVIDNLAALIWFANLGSIEFHGWGSRLPALEEPDMAFLDLDPGDEASFEQVVEAALCVRDLLEEIGVDGYVKTSGGRGLHVYIPLASGYTFKAVRTWVKRLARLLASRRPSLILVARGATHRGKEVSIDYAQNSLGRNMAVPYTVRAHPGAPVSTPLSWEELQANALRPEMFTLHTVPDRVRQQGDLFQNVLVRRQHLPELS